MKIKVISGFGGLCIFKDPFVKTLTAYCNKFGYEFICDFQKNWQKKFHKNGHLWTKHYLLEKHLADCDYLLWIDTDCIAINYGRRIESLITGDFDVLLTKENVVETGVMLFRNSDWTRNFIKEWGDYRDELSNNDNSQQVLERILERNKEVESHFKYVSDVDFTIKHTNFNNRNSNTLFMHVPGSTMTDKLQYMTEHSKRFNWKEDIYASFINLDHRHDRLQHMQQQLTRIGLKAERTRGLLPDEVNEPDHKTHVMRVRTPGAIGCHYSQVSVIEQAYSQGKSALVMEDDLVFCEDFNERMEIVEDFLNNHEWDVFCLGGTYHVPGEWHKSVNGKHVHPDLQMCECEFNTDAMPTECPNIMRTFGIWSTYGYIVNYKSIPKILALLDQNVYRSMGIDWLFILLQPQLQTFCFNPGMVKQYDNRSDIGRMGDGSPAITHFSGFAKTCGPHWFKEKIQLC